MVDTASNCGDLTAAFHSWHGLGSSPNNLDSGVGGSPVVHSNSLLPTFRRQGSMQSRKLLPSVPDMDTQLSLSAKMIDRRTCTPRGNHSYGPFFLEYSLLAEYNLLQKQKMPGVYVIPSEQSSLVWYGVIFIRQGIYQEGIFRFKVFIPDNYPDGDCPRLVFDHSVFHPLVDPTTHEMDVQRGFSHKWKRNVNHIWQILLYARRCFYKIDTKDPLNSEAAELYERSGQEDDGGDIEATFRERARDCVMDWRDRIYDKPNFHDPHYLLFSPFDPKVHEPARQAMLTPTAPSGPSSHPSHQEEHYISRKDSHSRKNGHTFLEPGSLRIFSSS